MRMFLKRLVRLCCTCRVTVIIAIVGQAVGLVHMLWKQIHADVFFLDWERARKVISRDGEWRINCIELLSCY
jgi:hypothetical protein